MTRKSLIAWVAIVLVGVLAQSVEADDRATNTDDLLIQAQRICPVTGKKLGSMGRPVKAEVNGATVFLCCKSCFGQPINKRHWSQVKANMANAQGMCPIFKKPLGEHPSPVVVNKRLLFVCCEPCVEKVEADPARAIAFVNDQLAKRAVRPRR